MKKLHLQTNENLDKYDYGIATLRIIMTFIVIVAHFLDLSNANSGWFLLLYRLKPLAVPTFLLISFYLFEKTVNQAEIRRKTITKRLTRLIIPYIIWPFIYVSILLILSKGYGIIVYEDESCSMKSQLFWQLLLGSARNIAPQFWYQAVLILYTIIVFCLFRFLKSEKAYAFLLLLAVFSLTFQYSGLNLMFFGELEYEQRYTLGRFFETAPYIIVGLSCASYKINLQIHNKLSAILGILLLTYASLNYPLFTRVDGFGYGGTYLLLTSLLIFLFFIALPFELLPKFAKKIINYVSKYSFGIFCSHYLIGNIYYYYLGEHNLPIYQFSGCIAIWGISFLVSIIISLIPTKIVKQLVQ